MFILGKTFNRLFLFNNISIPAAGGLYQSIKPASQMNSEIPWFIVYILLFYMAFGLLLLNIVLAVIVDAFGRNFVFFLKIFIKCNRIKR